MKRIELDRICSTWGVIRELGLRPSVERKVINDVIHYDINTVRELCMKNEDELLRIPSFNDVMISSLGEALAEYGLHFGMSEADLDDYIDREYVKTHGKPISFNGSKSVGKVILTNAAPPKIEKQTGNDSFDESVPHRPSVEVKEDSFIKASYFVVSFLGAMTGCMLTMIAKLLFTLITDIF